MSHRTDCTYSGKPEESRFLSNGMHGDVHLCLVCNWPFTAGGNATNGLPIGMANCEAEPQRLTAKEVEEILAENLAKRIARLKRTKLKQRKNGY